MEIPYILQVDPMVEWLEANAEGMLSREDLKTVAVRLGRNDYPALIFNLDQRVLISYPVLAFGVADAWQMAERPMRTLDPEIWQDFFDRLGFIRDGELVDGPIENPPSALYRGVTRPEDAAGWSWTEDRDQATWFADRFGTGHLYRTHPPRGALRMQLTGTFGREGESEWVVDPDLLVIEEVAR